MIILCINIDLTHCKVLDLQVISHQGITSTSDTESHSRQVNGSIDGLGESQIEFGSEVNLTFCTLSSSETAHDKGIVAANDVDFITLFSKLACLLKIGRDVVAMAGRCEAAGNTDNNDLFAPFVTLSSAQFTSESPD